MTGARTPSPGRPKRNPAGLRRWPELVAATLVLALGVGLGSLLLGERRAPAEPVATAPQPITAIPVSPGAVLADGSPQTAAPAQAPSGATAGTIPPAPAAPPAPKIPPPVLPEPRRMPAPPTPPRPVEETPTPASPITPPPTTQPPVVQTPTTQTPTTQTPAAQAPASPATEPAATEPAAPAEPEPVTPAPAPSEPATPAPAPGTPAAPPSAQRTPLRSDYRVMLGTFGNEAALRSATAGVSALGYTVYAIDLGNQFVAQVGPFADEATGQQAAADIRRAYARAELYPPRGQTLRNPAPSATSEAPATPESASEPASEPAAAAPAPAETPAPAGPVYVQVGAFNNVEGAQRFVEQLRAQGFSPSVNAPETGKVTVLLGPLSGSDLTTTEGQLDAAGLDHFRLR